MELMGENDRQRLGWVVAAVAVVVIDDDVVADVVDKDERGDSLGDSLGDGNEEDVEAATDDDDDDDNNNVDVRGDDNWYRRSKYVAVRVINDLLIVQFRGWLHFAVFKPSFSLACIKSINLFLRSDFTKPALTNILNNLRFDIGFSKATLSDLNNMKSNSIFPFIGGFSNNSVTIFISLLS